MGQIPGVPHALRQYWTTLEWLGSYQLYLFCLVGCVCGIVSLGSCPAEGEDSEAALWQLQELQR